MQASHIIALKVFDIQFVATRNGLIIQEFCGKGLTNLDLDNWLLVD
jgi:hypothetical protein